jgi:prepilin-type N-terminal cleavage/methylation domain-containing protein
MRGQSSHNPGFTLIELSIVLVVIGLIVGGILVGQSLINAAALRSQISQIEKYNTAANTFREKYGYLPGDITQQAVTQFNFTAATIRAGTPGSGDGNGELDGNGGLGSYDTVAYAWSQTGENLFFWEDLSTNSNLIEGGFNSATSYHGYVGNSGNSYSCTSITACSPYFPYAKIGNGAFVYVYSGYASKYSNGGPTAGLGPNFFGVAFINGVAEWGAVTPAPALTVTQAAAIDAKVDDGLPTAGNVLAQYLGGNVGQPIWSTNASSPNATTCYDTSSGTAKYSISYANGAMVNCGISFKMQAGD